MHHSLIVASASGTCPVLSGFSANGYVPVPPARATAQRLLARLGEATTAADARSLLEAAVSAYWHSLCPHLPVRPPFGKVASSALSANARAEAMALGLAAGALGVREAADLLGRLYTRVLPRDIRARHGIYYTPPVLADLLVQRAADAGTDWRSCRVLEPTCGKVRV